MIQEYLDVLPSTGMKKSETLNLRFLLWNSGISILAKYPIFGVGQIYEDKWYMITNLDFYHTILHNLYLDIAMTGGLVSLSLFIIWVLHIVNRSANKTRISNYLIGILFSFHVYCLVECPYTPFAFIIYALIYHIEELYEKDRVVFSKI